MYIKRTGEGDHIAMLPKASQCFQKPLHMQSSPASFVGIKPQTAPNMGVKLSLHRFDGDKLVQCLTLIKRPSIPVLQLPWNVVSLHM